jgi:hypothetical protein
MKLTIELDLDNAAFEDAPMTEAARILRRLATTLESYGPEHDSRLLDRNGNTVGYAKVTD